jgi:lysyl-tRNA synthetase class 2
MTHESDQVVQRRANLEALRQLGVPVYPNRFEASASVEDIVREHGGRTGEELETAQVTTRVAARIVGIRSFGKANFLVLSDGKARLQVYVRQDSVPERDFSVFKLLDFGDWVGVEGRLFRTKTNELTVWSSRLVFLAKCLLPLPEKWHGLQDVEIRYRQRYLDLIVNPDSRRVFEIRSRVVSALRAFLIGRGFLEVETPMMQAIAGGALARPFATHHNALDMPLYLRIAPELYLKRLTVGGIERVFEINRNFRNEGISTQHNPEFTMLEFYWAYADYHDLMTLTEEMLSEVARAATGSNEVTFGDQVISFNAPFRRLSLREAAASAASRRLDAPVEAAVLRSRADAAALAGRLGLEVAPGVGPGRSSRRCARNRWCSRPSSTTSQRRYRRSRSSGPTTPTPSSGSSCTSRGSRSRTPSASSTIRWSSGAASRPSCRAGREATTRRTRWTRTTCGRWSMACRRPRARGSASIAW